MWHAIASPVGIMIIFGLVALLAIGVAIVGIRAVSGSSRKARKADSLRKIAEVNRAGYLDDVGTIKIDARRQRRHLEGYDDHDD
jgi:hypothetical protein